MTPPKFTADSWQKIALVCISTLVTVLVLAGTYGTHLVTRTEAVTLIESTAPYVYDRAAITRSIETNGELLKRITSMLTRHDAELARYDERIKTLESH